MSCADPRKAGGRAVQGARNKFIGINLPWPRGFTESNSMKTSVTVSVEIEAVEIARVILLLLLLTL